MQECSILSVAVQSWLNAERERRGDRTSECSATGVCKYRLSPRLEPLLTCTDQNDFLRETWHERGPRWKFSRSVADTPRNRQQPLLGRRQAAEIVIKHSCVRPLLSSLFEKSILCSTGFQSVPSVDSPDGTASESAANLDARFAAADSSIPVG